MPFLGADARSGPQRSVGRFVALKAAGVRPCARHYVAQRCDALGVRLVHPGRPKGIKVLAGLALTTTGLYVTAEKRLLHPGDRAFQKRAEKLRASPRAASTTPTSGRRRRKMATCRRGPPLRVAGMAVYRLGTKKGACALVAGDVNKHEDWRDGAGAAARFSRPHQMAAFRANELLLTDIDNRAVRRITLADGRASTVPYDNHHLYTELWRLGGPQRHDHGQYVYPAPDNSGDRGGGGRRCAARGAAVCPPPRCATTASGAPPAGAAWTSQSAIPLAPLAGRVSEAQGPRAGKEAHLRRMGRRVPDGRARRRGGCSLRVHGCEEKGRDEAPLLQQSQRIGRIIVMLNIGYT